MIHPRSISVCLPVAAAAGCLWSGIGTPVKSNCFRGITFATGRTDILLQSSNGNSSSNALMLLHSNEHESHENRTFRPNWRSKRDCPQELDFKVIHHQRRVGTNNQPTDRPSERRSEQNTSHGDCVPNNWCVAAKLLKVNVHLVFFYSFGLPDCCSYCCNAVVV